MTKLSILIVDHEEQRGENLKKKISEFNYSVSHYLYVWGNQKNDNPVCAPKDFVGVANVNFVHSNNTCAKEFVDFILEKHTTSWVIEYSGGGLEAMGNRTPKTSKHILYPKSIGLDAQFENLHEFLEAVSRLQENAGDVLLGFSPLLEAKLELLHALLVPPEATNEEDFNNKMNFQLSELRKHAGAKYDEAWLDFVKGKPWKYHSDEFNDAYVGNDGLLTKLRNGLLHESIVE